MNIKVYFRHSFEGGSYIEDNDTNGMPLFNIGYELKDKNRSVRLVSNFIGYGFEKDTLFVELFDSTRGHFYISYTYAPDKKGYLKPQAFRKHMNYKPRKWYDMDDTIMDDLRNIAILFLMLSLIKIFSMLIKR